jgi:ATP-dependent RNA helicase DeaD
MTSPSFDALGLAAPILGTLQELGYEQPTPIQAQAIPLLLAGDNLLGVAQTGTGKTAAFALPLLSNLDAGQRAPQCLVLTPTRELAIQVAEAFQRYARHLGKFHVLPIYGGQDMGTQLRALKRGVQVVVGTPGRIQDHLRRGSLDLGSIRSVVLDEADEMLRMGFIDDVESILAETPEGAQRALFSATMPAPIARIAARYLPDARQVHIESKTRTVERIEQSFLLVANNNEKLDALTRILEVESFDGLIVFVRTKANTVELAEKLEARGFAAAALNGDLNQQLRERTVGRLKSGDLDIIVATDVAARGLDVERISHVINFDVPYDAESYVHRIGRTGRAGREGRAILFVTHRERRLLHSIEKSTRQPIAPMSLPSGAQVGEQRRQQFLQELEEMLNRAELGPFRDLVLTFAETTGSEPVDIAAALVYRQQRERPLFPTFREPKKAPDKQKKERGERPEKNRGGGRPAATDSLAMETYRLEVGRDHGVQPKDIVGAIANEADLESQYIGRIEIQGEYSTVDLPEGMPKPLLQHLRRMRICQQPSGIHLLTSDGKRVPHKPAGRPGARAGNLDDRPRSHKSSHKKARTDERGKTPAKPFKAKSAKAGKGPRKRSRQQHS